ncbi:ribonuclease HII (plasmid) [Paracoccus sp. TK19116]|uniref:Ribonuclease HII n=1 Tax=Paracoccus albicereus TaxID=2922394 RepID=A0ABT1MLP2_9RHOB|nr:ribonuclease HII [Paracoccus albicereus]MCQ0969101.1 ribonuclease HII [Paracoccus albicereus]
MNGPDGSFEMAALARGARRVAGVDEVGRGPLAGPVTAAAVVLDLSNLPEGLDDSKKLTAARREVLADWVMTRCDWSVAHVPVEDIDRLNIYHAAHLAMCLAIAGLRTPPCHVLVDGNRVPRDLRVSAEAVIGGDARCLTIAAASIVAKVLRDRIMVDLAQQHPGYGWEVNAGYPTPAHKRALLDFGLTPHHRRSFKPVHNILCRDEIASA